MSTLCVRLQRTLTYYLLWRFRVHLWDGISIFPRDQTGLENSGLGGASQASSLKTFSEPLTPMLTGVVTFQEAGGECSFCKLSVERFIGFMPWGRHLGNADWTQALKSVSGETEAQRAESAQQVGSQAGSRTLKSCVRGPRLVFSFGLLVPLLPAPTSPGYADHMGLTRFRRRFQALDPLLMKKLMLAAERIDERKVRGVGGDGGWRPWMLLFLRT